MMQRVIPFAQKNDARAIPFGASKAEWDAMSPQQRWRLNDGALRARINERDNFRYVVRNNRTGDIIQVSDRAERGWKAPWD